MKVALWIVLLGMCSAPPPPPPPLSPRVAKLLNDLGLNQYDTIFFNEEIDLQVLAQLKEEQLSRIGIRTMGQRIRIMNAAQDALANSVNGQSVRGQSENGSSVNGEVQEAETEEGTSSLERSKQGYVGVQDEITAEDEDQGTEDGVEEAGTEEGTSSLVRSKQGYVGVQDETTAEDEDEGTEDPFEFEIVTKTTSTGKKTHHIFVGENKYLSRGIKKNGQAWFYCNFVSVHHKCTSSFRVRYHNLANPMDEIPAIETQPSPHIMTDGVPHLADKVKRVKESMREKVYDAIRVDPLRPIREIHEECLNNALDTIADADERILFCQQMPTYRQCERNERRFRNRLIPPNPPTAREIRTDGIFTLDPDTGVNIVCFDDQGEADQDRIIALSHPEVQRYVIGVFFLQKSALQ